MLHAFWNILEHSGTFLKILEHSRTFWNILEKSGSFCMHSGTFCMHSWIFWNILEQSGCCNVERCRKAHFQVDHTQTDIRTCRAASSQPKTFYPLSSSARWCLRVCQTPPLTMMPWPLLSLGGAPCPAGAATPSSSKRPWSPPCHYHQRHLYKPI